MTINRKDPRLFALALALLCLALAVAVMAVRDNTSYYMTPSEMAATSARPLAGGRDLRLGGVMVYGTLEQDSLSSRFVLTDYASDIDVAYAGGALPGAAREGEGVIVTGTLLEDNVFHARKITPARTIAAALERRIPALRKP